MTRLYLPQDAAALAVGADRVLRALREAAATRGATLDVVRTGTRGAVWLAPLLEVETPAGRVAYGPVTAKDAAAVLDAILDGGDHPLCIGDPGKHPWFAGQTRLTFARCGIVDPVSAEDYAAHGGLAGLRRALAIGPVDTVEEVRKSGLRGRGGAGFPTGIKWETVRKAAGGGTGTQRKYIVCNADEGDSGTFADRILMEGDPFCLIEGMAIAGVAVGATQGYVYIRSEYPHAVKTMRAAILAARAAGVLGPDMLGSGLTFDMEVRVGAGAYICGEETSLLQSLEGKRGTVRAKPPLPALEGLFARPTVVNNVLSLASVPWIMAHGGPAYAALGCGRSLGTLAVQLAGNVQRGGLIELPFGVALRAIIEDWGQGTLSGRPFRAVQVGGPLGAYFPEALLDTPMDYEAFGQKGGLLGHGGVVVFDDSVDLAAQARFAFEFCATESCGKCTPCRIGSVRGMEVIDRITGGIEPARNMAVLEDLCVTMTDASLCAMGGLTPVPVVSALRHFPQDFGTATQLPAAAE
ncbi:MAG: formate dehydrogenase beta subunit [Janthinobacterium lividum]